MTRHGALQHYLRPDGVYITSVLQPFANFNPVPDTQAVAASFVSPGALAGPVALWGCADGGTGCVPMGSVKSRWQAFKARVQLNLQTQRLRRTARAVSAAVATAPGQAITIDASPRPPNANVAAIAVTSGWAPSPQSPRSNAAAVYMPAQGDPPAHGPVATGVAMAQNQAAFPQNFWNRVIRDGLPPVVAARAQDDVLTKWFGVKSPTGAGY
jgi:hypothetical protein